MATQVVARIDAETKKRFAKLARMEGKSSSQIVRDLIKEYVRDRDISSYIDHLWDRIGSSLSARGVTASNVEKAIREVRKKKAGDARRR